MPLPLRRTALAGAICLGLGCGSAEPPAPPPPEVLVVEATAEDVPVTLEWLGTTEGAVDADIRAQVAGYLVSRDYREGSRVEPGALLFRIDPRPFEAALEEARGDLGRAEAARELSRLDVGRYQPLVETGAVSRQEYDTAVQRLRSDEAALQAARAAVEKARIELGFTQIRAPIGGIVGVAKRQLGDFVGPSDPDPLTSVSQLDPIRVSFQVSEQEYLKFAPGFQQAVVAGHFEGDGRGVEMVLADGTVYPHRGVGYPAGREIDPRTGTITVKADFPNPGPMLRPGQYARIRAVGDVARGAVVVPQRALQDLQGMAQLTVVGANDEVEVRTVATGPRWGTLQVVTQGLAAGERVVVEGFQKVRPGMKVAPKPAPPELAGAPPAPAPVAAPAPAAAAPPPPPPPPAPES
jgi:membrane fusion protein (multidrug efflux system)